MSSASFSEVSGKQKVHFPLMSTSFLAVDLGATSGRTILGTLQNGRVSFRELTRFPNPIINMFGHFHWDIFHLYNEVVKGLVKAKEAGSEVKSIGIDTWGVDFAFVGKDGGILRSPYSYRDPQTVGMPDDYFRTRIPRDVLYEKTGIQTIDINSIFQLHALNKRNDSALRAADKILFTPDALAYLLTGEKVTEYTIASTSQLLNPRTKELDNELLESVGVRREMFGRMVFPGDKIGTLAKHVQEITGLGPIPVIAVGGHDTASAVAATPAESKKFAYLSSGTWSLMGIEVNAPIITKESSQRNYTNEGGVGGTIRFLKNICGMWLLESCRRVWNHNDSYDTLAKAAEKVKPFQSLINPDSPCFANPQNMVQAIAQYCVKTNQKVPTTTAENVRCIYDSLALRYRQVIADLQYFAPFQIENLNIIGGGSVNNTMNKFTANAVNMSVIAGPQEATALGNICVQAKAIGLINNIRETVRDSVSIKRYQPTEPALWADGFEKYLKVFREDI